MSPQKYLNTFYRYLLMSVVVLALIGVGIAFLPKIRQHRRYQETREKLEAEIRVEEQRIQELRLNQEKFSTDKHFVQKIAHEIGFAHEGETIYQFDDDTSTNTESRMK